MRGDPRSNERIVLALEQRQLFFVLMGVLVLASGILMVGYVLGRRFAGTEPKTPREALAEAEAETQGEEGVAVHFRKELAEPSDPLDRPPVAPVGEPAAAMAEAKAEKKAEKEPQPKKDEPAAKAPPAEAPKPKEPEPPKDPVRERVQVVSAEAARALRNLEVSGRKAGARRRMRFTLQVSAFQDRAEALELMARLRKRGHNPYLTSSVVEGRGRWYRVRVGKFSDRAAAEEYKRRFEASEKTSTFITRL